MKDRIAAAVFLVIVITVIAVILIRRTDRDQQKPESVVYEAFDAARTGDIRAYMQCFGPAMREELKAAMTDAGKDVFRQQLRNRAEQITGLALTCSATSEQTDEAVFVVELVFRDRNEKQEYRIGRKWGRWRILAIGVAAPVKMPIPYGTPVIPEDVKTPNVQ